MVARKPDHQGEHEISRKTIAQGRPDVSAEPVCSCAHFLCIDCTRDRGCSAHPVFPAPFLEGAELNLQTSDKAMSREREHISTLRHSGARAVRAMVSNCAPGIDNPRARVQPKRSTANHWHRGYRFRAQPCGLPRNDGRMNLPIQLLVVPEDAILVEGDAALAGEIGLDVRPRRDAIVQIDQRRDLRARRPSCVSEKRSADLRRSGTATGRHRSAGGR